MENNKMKKLLSLFAAIVVLSGCSSLGGMFGGAECDSKLARDFMLMPKTEYSLLSTALRLPTTLPKFCRPRLNG